MPKCLRCLELKEQVLWLREQNKNLADRLLAVSNPNVLAAFRPELAPSGEFYGSSGDEQVAAYDEFGQLISVDKDKLETQ